jgi:hypothetical protein
MNIYNIDIATKLGTPEYDEDERQQLLSEMGRLNKLMWDKMDDKVKIPKIEFKKYRNEKF